MSQRNTNGATTGSVRYFLVKEVDGVEVKRTEISLCRDGRGQFVSQRPDTIRRRMRKRDCVTSREYTCPSCGYRGQMLV